MNETTNDLHHPTDDDPMKKIIGELQDLENEYVDANGIKLRPSQCYHIDDNPFHILYNTNCPEALKKRIDIIVSRYLPK